MSKVKLPGDGLASDRKITEYFARANRDVAASPRPISVLSAAPANACAGSRPLSISQYLSKLKNRLASGELQLGHDPWVLASCPFNFAQNANTHGLAVDNYKVTPEDALNLVLRPDVFIWAPDVFASGAIKCPSCNSQTSAFEWGQPRHVVALNRHCMYLAKQYICRACPAQVPRHAKQRVKQRKFASDSAEVMAMLPKHVSALWQFVSTGKYLYDEAIANIVRAMAIKTSWSGIAEAMNEVISSSWLKNITYRYVLLCEKLGIKPLSDPVIPPQCLLTDKRAKELYMLDAAKRIEQSTHAPNMQLGDDILKLDWTRDAAARCKSHWLFNAMSGNRRILASVLCESCTPTGTTPILAAMSVQGIAPKVVYVDDDCCGAWPEIIKGIWPGACVKLDCMHALRRLTQTTASTQHPWHTKFCNRIGQAFFEPDLGTLSRLAKALNTTEEQVSKEVRDKFVPRRVRNSDAIVRNVEEIFSEYDFGVHPKAGSLLTDETKIAWANLRQHVEQGCLQDPQNVKLNLLEEPVALGNDCFHPVRPLRGVSALEGFHTHQKQWLGQFAQHSEDAGRILLADGATRWNYKRYLEESGAEARAFTLDSRLAAEIEVLRQRGAANADQAG